MAPWLLLFLAVSATAQTLADLGQSITTLEFDPAECYRVRDLHFSRGPLRFYLTEGHLTFAKPINGRTLAAVFTADVEGGDGELLLIPPTRGERASLASFTGSPNLSEHLRGSLFLFTDTTGDDLRKAVAGQDAKKATERGLLITSEWNAVVRNFATSFLIRYVRDLGLPSDGFFYAAVQGTRLGNFDVIHDHSSGDRTQVGALRWVDQRRYFDVWTSFRPNGAGEAPREVKVHGYRIESVVEEDLQLRVATTMTLEPLVDNLSLVSLDVSSSMKVTSAMVNGDPAEVFSRDSLRANLMRRGDNSLFLIRPAQPLRKGVRYEVLVENEGSVIHSAGGDVFFVGSRSNWHPRADAGFATYDLTFHYPERLQLVFPGDVKEDKTEAGQRTTRRVVAAPIRLAGFNLGNYESVRKSRGPLNVEVFANRKLEARLARPAPPMIVPAPPVVGFPRQRRPDVQAAVMMTAPPPPDPLARLDSLAGEIADAFEYLSKHLGAPALANLNIAPIPGMFGQGFPGLVYLSTVAYLEPRDRPAVAKSGTHRIFFDEILHTHEVAHQWWGNVVTSETVEDEWLMEALANYSALMTLEKRKGSKTLQEVLDAYREHLLEKTGEHTIESSGPIRLGTRLESSQSPGAWHAIVYEKGSWILHMLRRRMGEAQFLAFLGKLVESHRNEALSTAEFEKAVLAHLPQPARPGATPFFDWWIDSTGLPSFSVESTVRGKAPRMTLEVRVRPSQPEAEGLEVPVIIEQVRGKPVVHWIPASNDSAPLRIPVRSKPARVEVDSSAILLSSGS